MLWNWFLLMIIIKEYTHAMFRLVWNQCHVAQLVVEKTVGPKKNAILVCSDLSLNLYYIIYALQRKYWAWNHYALLSSSPTCVSGLLYWTERDVHIVSPDIGWGHLTKVKVTSSPTWHLPIYFIYFLLKICHMSKINLMKKESWIV